MTGTPSACNARTPTAILSTGASSTHDVSACLPPSARAAHAPRARRVLTALAVASVVALGLGASPAQAVGFPESRSGYCTTADTDAVTVVIDFGDLGGGVRVYCATGLKSGATGMDALHAAGVSVTGTQQSGSGVVCRLNGKPSADQTISLPGNPDYQEKCVDTPPAGAYWSYWSATAGGSWTYNSRGVLQNRVKLGGYEGWSFAHGSKRAPGVTPAVHNPPKPAPTAKPTAKPKPTATAKPKVTTAAPKPTTTNPPKPSATSGPAQSPPTATPTGADASSNPPEPGVAASPPVAASDPATPATPEATPDPGPGSAPPTSLIVGAAAIVVIAGAASVMAVRRRRRP